MFTNRVQAGQHLALAAEELALPDPVILALPRGGVPIAAEVATRLSAPLDVLLVRKVGLPTRPEFAIGAVGEGGVVIAHRHDLVAAGITPQEFQRLAAAESEQVRARALLYRPHREMTSITGRDAVIVDDGLATGATAEAAIAVARAHKPRSITLAIPVAPAEALPRLGSQVDHLICLLAPEFFGAV
ncbi:MAG: hypothetical protein RJB01_1823, partial [Actinomycetota bacterium]